MALVPQIYSFKGQHAWLSSFCQDYPILIGDVTFPTREHAYQYAKTYFPPDMSSADENTAQYIGLVIQQIRLDILNAPTPGAAKRLGQTVPMDLERWNKARVRIMQNLIRFQCQQYPELAQKLLATDDIDLIEGNAWGDKFWGVVDCIISDGILVDGNGENWLGKSWMVVRKELCGITIQ